MESSVLILSKVMDCFDPGLIFRTPAVLAVISGTSTKISYDTLMLPSRTVEINVGDLRWRKSSR